MVPAVIPAVKGTQDFIDMTLFNHVVDVIKQQCILYNYTEIATPTIEHIELFKRSLGLHTDVVSKEMFVIQPRTEESDVLCLRPEATAPTMRVFLSGKVQTSLWKVFSYGSMFRYERPQKGRFREFHQFNIEAIGAASILQDVELIAMFDKLFVSRFNIPAIALAINFLGCREDRMIFSEKLRAFAKKHEADLCETCKNRAQSNIMRIFDCKNERCQEIYRTAPKTIEHLCDACNAEWTQLQDNLSMLSVSYSVVPALVRGLDYYNKTVFEFSSSFLGAQNALCGGGRYDHLAQTLGHTEAVPSCGAAIGLERLLAILEAMEYTTHRAQATKLVVVIPLAPAQQSLALMVADDLRASGIQTELLLDIGSLKSMLRRADKLGAPYVAIIGENEHKAGVAKIKHMTDSIENDIPLAKLVDYIKKQR